MKFGKEFKKQMVPEWIEAYLDYNGLKRMLREIRLFKQSKQQPVTPSRASQHKFSLHMAFSGQTTLKSTNLPSEKDIEDQVIDVNTMQQEGSRKFYKTKFLRQPEGGENEVAFFRKLDEELNKVNTFYRDKVEEVMHEATLLDKQMNVLTALRIKMESANVDGSNTTNIASTTSPLRTADQSGVRTPGREHIDLTLGKDMGCDNQLDESTDVAEINPVHTTHCSSVCREEVDIIDHKSVLLEILEHVKVNNTLETPTLTIKRVFKDSREEDLSFEKEELKKVEEQLKIAFIEFYQKLRLLKNYSFMNLAAFAKIMKKYEKITSRGASRPFMKTVDKSYIGSSDEVTGLLERVEITFIKHFSNSNRKEGMKLLRPKVKREKHSVTFLSGFFSGCLVALLISLILHSKARNLVDKEEGTLYMENIFPLYSLFAYIVLHMLMYAANIFFWRRYRVNYPFIFGFKQGTELGYREVFLLSTGLSVLSLAAFLASMDMDLGFRSQSYKKFTELIPLGLLTVVLVITFCPFNIIYRSSRCFLIRCIHRCVCAPLYKVRLPDFFLADHLTSQVQTIRSFTLYICYYGSGEFLGRQNKCHSNDVYNVIYFIVAVIPYWIRFLQNKPDGDVAIAVPSIGVLSPSCLRRLFEEKDAVHGYNGLKYLLTIVAVVIRTAFELKKGMTWMVLALVSSTVATIMNTYWDIIVDWGLLRRQSKNFCLRDKLLVSHKSVYFVAMVLNILLRFAWLQSVLPFKLHSLHKVAVSTTMSCLEIIRRGIWSFFRLENEHLNNVGKYRAFNSVPLPFSYYDNDNDNDD